jgi:hypothetical protein
VTGGAVRASRRWPLVAAIFATGFAAALLLPTPGRHDGGAREGAAAADRAPASSPDTAGGAAVVREGVPRGFARTEAGAVAAAASFVCTGQALLDMDPLSAEDAVRELSAAASEDELVRRHLRQLEAARDVLASGTGPIVFRQSALAWRVEAYDDDRARVAIWNVGVLSREGVAPPQASWSTSVVELVWEGGDWRVWGESISPGPTPILDDSDAPSTNAQLDEALAGFTDFGARS